MYSELTDVQWEFPGESPMNIWTCIVREGISDYGRFTIATFGGYCPTYPTQTWYDRGGVWDLNTHTCHHISNGKHCFPKSP